MSDFDEGDIDFEFESDGGYGAEEEEGDDLTVQIENTFYEAEDHKIGNPNLAIAQFLKVIDLDAQRGETNGSQSGSNWTFKALLNIVVTCASLKRYGDVLAHYERLLQLLTHVTRNEASEAIDQVLDALGGRRGGVDIDVEQSKELQHLESVYGMTLESLKAGGYQKLWFDTSLKLANLYIQQNNVNALKKSIKELYAVCAPTSDPTYASSVSASLLPRNATDATSTSQLDISKQSANLFELFALDTQLCLMTKDADRMRRVYPKTLQMAASVTDPRTVAIVRECGGLMYMEDKKWDAAYSEFFEAFKNYQEIGSITNAKKSLKFVVVANLLSLSEINPFHSREATVYQSDPDISAVHQLRLAFDSKNTEKIGQLLTDPSNHLLQDSTIAPYLTDLLRNIRLQLVQQTIAPYTSMKLPQLAQTLSISEMELMPLLVKLILDKTIDAEIDGQNNVLKIHSTDQFGFKREMKVEEQNEESKKDEVPMAAATSSRSGLTPAVEAMLTEYTSLLRSFSELSNRIEINETSSMSGGIYEDHSRSSRGAQRIGCSNHLYQARRRGGTALSSGGNPSSAMIDLSS